MEKESNIMQTVILGMKVILLIIDMKGMEKIF